MLWIVVESLKRTSTKLDCQTPRTPEISAVRHVSQGGYRLNFQCIISNGNYLLSSTSMGASACSLRWTECFLIHPSQSGNTKVTLIHMLRSFDERQLWEPSAPAMLSDDSSVVAKC